MNSQTDYERFYEGSEGNRRLLAQEELLFDVSDAIHDALEREGMTQKQLADSLGCTPSFVSQVLAGDQNLTLRTLADIAHAMDFSVQFQFRKNIAVQRHWALPKSTWGSFPQVAVRGTFTEGQLRDGEKVAA